MRARTPRTCTRSAPAIDEPAPSTSSTTPVDDGDGRAATANVLPERAQRRAPPGDERPDPHQQQQRQPEDAEEEVVVRPADDDRLAAHGLGEDRADDAPEDRQAERDEQQVVVEERRLARDERLEPVFERSSGSRQRISAIENDDRDDDEARGTTGRSSSARTSGSS